MQIDTDDSLNIMWGDSGVANFFIRKEDLLNLDFPMSFTIGIVTRRYK